MVEAVTGTVFNDHHNGESKEKLKKADHGYSPFKANYQTIFAASGPNIKTNLNIEQMSLVDIAPTLAKLLDLDLKDYDGQVLDIIKEK